MKGVQQPQILLLRNPSNFQNPKKSGFILCLIGCRLTCHYHCGTSMIKVVCSVGSARAFAAYLFHSAFAADLLYYFYAKCVEIVQDGEIAMQNSGSSSILFQNENLCEVVAMVTLVGTLCKVH
jgi:hypothetical protein